MKGKTKEEKYLVNVYQTALKLGDIYCAVDRFEVGNAIGLHPRGIKTISHQLTQANFIKKISDSQVSLTPHGEKLVHNLIDE